MNAQVKEKHLSTPPPERDAPTETPDRPYVRLVDAAANAGRIAALSAALCYGLGLTVTNIHFGKFGYHSFGLVRTYYVTAGLWALLILWFSALAIIYFRAHFMGVQGTPRQKAWAYVRKGLWFALGSVFLFYYVGTNLHCGSRPLFLAVIGGLTLIITLWNNTPNPGKLSEHPLHGFVQGLQRRALFAHLALPWLLVAALFYLGAIASLWGQLPIAFGGGRPTSIVVTVDSSVVTRSSLLAAGFVPDSAWIIMGSLLSREDQYFVISPRGRRSASLLPVRAVGLAHLDPQFGSTDSTLAASDWISPKESRRQWWQWWGRPATPRPSPAPRQATLNLRNNAGLALDTVGTRSGR